MKDKEITVSNWIDKSSKLCCFDKKRKWTREAPNGTGLFGAIHTSRGELFIIKIGSAIYGSFKISNNVLTNFFETDEKDILYWTKEQITLPEFDLKEGEENE